MTTILITLAIVACAVSFLLGATIAGGKRLYYEARILMLEDAAETALALLRQIHSSLNATTDWYAITQLEEALTDPESE